VFVRRHVFTSARGDGAESPKGPGASRDAKEKHDKLELDIPYRLAEITRNKLLSRRPAREYREEE
jgi:hypothetical protein